MKKAIILILVTTFIGSYGTFKVIKETSNNAMYYDVKWYNLFIPYEKEISRYYAEDAFVDSLVIAYTNMDIKKLRPKVLMGTLLAFLLSLYPAYGIYKKKTKRMRITGILISFFLFVSSCSTQTQEHSKEEKKLTNEYAEQVVDDLFDKSEYEVNYQKQKQIPCSNDTTFFLKDADLYIKVPKGYILLTDQIYRKLLANKPTVEEKRILQEYSQIQDIIAAFIKQDNVIENIILSKATRRASMELKNQIVQYWTESAESTPHMKLEVLDSKYGLLSNGNEFTYISSYYRFDKSHPDYNLYSYPYRYQFTYSVNVGKTAYKLSINTLDKDFDYHLCTATSLKKTNSTEIYEESLSEYVYFKDGVKMSRSKLINSCITTGSKDGMDKVVDIKSYCNCVLDKLAANFKSTEVTFLFTDVDKSHSNIYQKAQDFYHRPKIRELTEPCIMDNLYDVQDNIKITSAEQKEMLINEFKNALKAQPDYEEFAEFVDIDGFCECMVVDLLEFFSYKEIMTDPDFANNPKYNLIQTNCAFKHQKD